MNHCVKCGVELDEAAAACGNCGWDREADRGGVLCKRSDGGSLIGFGWCGIVFGLLFSLISMFPTGGGTYTGYGVTPPTYHFGWAVIGGALLNVGLLVLLAGFVVRALWFLPGPEHKRVPGTRTISRAQSPARSPLTRPGAEGAQL